MVRPFMTPRTGQLGIFGVPTFAPGNDIFWDDDRLDGGARQRGPQHAMTLLFGKKLHGFVREHAAGDRDRREWRLGGDFGAWDHDLIDLARELLH